MRQAAEMYCKAWRRLKVCDPCLTTCTGTFLVMKEGVTSFSAVQVGRFAEIQIRVAGPGVALWQAAAGGRMKNEMRPRHA